MSDRSRVAPALLALFALLSCRAPAATTAPDHGPVDHGTGPARATVESEVALLEFYPRLGELDANIHALTEMVAEALDHGANLVVAPELATTGYAITAAQVQDELGLDNPFPQLEPIRALAAAHDAYVYLGVAERAPGPDRERLYNSVVYFGPDRLVGVQRKRGVAMWNERGDLPFGVVSTPFGDIATIICSDSYLMDWVRISTLAGADIILTPANWWGASGQEHIWQARARENGVWMVVANRWGTEIDRRFNPPYTYDMNDAPSAVISPDGALRLIHRAQEEPHPVNQILYARLQVPTARIGAAFDATYTVAERRVSAYAAIGNSYYRPDQGDQPPPGLPPAGPATVATLAYQPQADADANLTTIASLLDRRAENLDVLVLPGLGISSSPVNPTDPDWHSQPPWDRFIALLEARSIGLAVTTILDQPSGSTDPRLALLAVRPGQPPLVRPQVHDAWGMRGTGEPPGYIDLPHTRVAMLTGQDSLFPEMATHLAKQGVDLVVISSSIGAVQAGTVAVPEPAAGPTDWQVTDLQRTWATHTNQCFHLAATDAGGHGLVVEDGGCFAVHKSNIDLDTPVWIGPLDSSTERQKHLNGYYPFDLRSLLGQ
ncbi:nitrilase-related carbon-nitrogen hydrolase [Haliangium sp.]|uniref:nitrilase-related carbon-nitrogen hydrolase n=1 Tax=Haliangium sp. TaxID=2663208 RepID=UPI003D0A97BF